MNEKILVIAEGVSAERRFMESMKNAFQFEHTFCCMNGNIYLLYKRMKELDFNADVKSVLLEMHPEYRDQLEERFAYTYLVFDMDPHHGRRGDDRTIDGIVMDNCHALQEMVRYFVDETDPSIGRLYVNYPMLESYRSCDSTFDENYSNEYVNLDGIASFKQYAGTKKLASKHLDDYSSNDFMQLAKQNIYKLGLICLRTWNKMSYEQYLVLSQQTRILDEQMKLIDRNRCVAVLNTSLLIILDYYGNRDGFYDCVMMNR